ncbi:MAG: RS21-C6 protein [Leptospiraceae bacterium]|nr:hypothetical protein [Leptospiraceae bacterium]MCP5512195.1 RS21-C6 protein [Leptospiraceae bacterium]
MNKKISDLIEQLSESSSLSSLQTYNREVCSLNGWDKSSYQETFLLWMEEVGELAKAIRYREKIYVEEGNDKKFDLEGEFADVLSYLLQLSNVFEIDLQKAFIEKEKINLSRSWSSKKE